jgi:hypothetical protein
MSISNVATKLSKAFLLSAALGSAACAADMPEGTGAGEEVASAAQATLISDCLTYQRGTEGTVADATLWQTAPGYNDGSYTSVTTGTSSSGFKQLLLHFDISNVPAGAHIDSADLYLYKSWKEKGSTVYVHEVLAPWSESSVTYASFAGSYDPTPATSFLAWGGGGYNLAFPVDALVQGWVDGVSPNHGILLQDLTLYTSFHSSEHADVATRPELEVCYTLNP